MNKTDFDSKLTSFNKRITWNKTKHLEVQKKRNSLITNADNLFLGRMYFTNNDGSQNTFVYQPILDTFELKKDIFNSKLKPLYTAFLDSIKLSEYKIGIKFDKDPLGVKGVLGS